MAVLAGLLPLLEIILMMQLLEQLNAFSNKVLGDVGIELGAV
jgi:hypothetical protein